METPTHPPIATASVKVMRSHDYCHFETVLTSNEIHTPEDVDALRKVAAHLVDKAVHQYKVAKAAAARVSNIRDPWQLTQAEKVPEGERSPAQKAVIKYHQDAAFAARFDYDYQDGFEDWTLADDEADPAADPLDL